MGTWMHETGAQWLMTSLDSRPVMVASVRTAMAIPVFLLALPAGVWADRFDRRHWLISTQIALLCMATLMAVLAKLEWFTPTSLLALTSLMGVAMVLNQPAWQALTPELVPPALVPSAVAAGSVSFNLARSLGPALGGLIIATVGIWATFAFNAFSFLGVIVALILWQSNTSEESHRTKSQPFMQELKKGIFLITTSSHLRNVMLRVLVYTCSASILWSLLALVATEKLQFLERGFGSCWGLIGAGAVAGAWILPVVRRSYSSEAIVLAADLLYATILGCIGFIDSRWLLMPMLVLIGALWMTSMTTLNATAQVYLPRRFRARGMAAYLMFFAIGMALGSIIWGSLGSWLGLDAAFRMAAITLSLSAMAVFRMKIGSLNDAGKHLANPSN